MKIVLYIADLNLIMFVEPQPATLIRINLKERKVSLLWDSNPGLSLPSRTYTLVVSPIMVGCPNGTLACVVEFE